MSWKTLFRCVLAVSLTMLSYGVGGTAETRRHDAHVHGVAEINIAVEGTKATVEFRAPAESVMGFEHEAKSESAGRSAMPPWSSCEPKRGKWWFLIPSWVAKPPT